ncbi:hypothetical protein BKA61DRAFT_598096 [Leptodontidium sp. MPI-SDFR-AT-0119]|nr:hypothetical protein BKA61DRAFT_598096 [Leptodontidium sp. MPI-SDFR-AT-0119]
MSFGFSVSDFVQVGALLGDLRTAYRTAPREYRSLVTYLDVLSGLFLTIEQHRENPATTLGRCTPEQEQQLGSILEAIRTVLRDLERYRDEFQVVVEGRGLSRVWSRTTFPRQDVNLLQARLHMSISSLRLFLDTLDRDLAATMMQVIEGLAREQRLATASMEILMARLTEQGISEEDLAPHQPELEEFLEAVQEVSETASNLAPNSALRSSAGTGLSPSVPEALTIFGSTVFGGEEEAVREEQEEIFIGAPDQARLQSGVCLGAQMLVRCVEGGISQRRNWVLAAFGSTKYEIRCRKCRFVGFQDEKLDSLRAPKNTPLFFSSRRVPLEPSSLEYNLQVHVDNRKQVDGLFYRSIFFWKCHVPCTVPTRHHEGLYECPFCPFEISAGSWLSRDDLLEHILTLHVQSQPSLELRRAYNCWIEDSPALFDELHGRLRGRAFDMLLPRPYSAREGMIARVTRDQPGRRYPDESTTALGEDHRW